MLTGLVLSLMLSARALKRAFDLALSFAFDEGWGTMNMLRTATVVISVVAGLPLVLCAQVPPDAGLQVDRIFTPWSSVSSPGCAVAVSKDGLTIFSRGYGMADLEHDVRNSAETIFEGGSLSKQFTAAAIMLLVMDGKLSLDDDVRDYVPEVPDYGTKVTLRHMMTHTSRLRDWGSVAQISGWGRGERSHDHSDVIDIVSRQSALNFEGLYTKVAKAGEIR